MYPWRHLCKGCSINTDRTDGTQDSCILRACARQTQDRYPSLRRMCTRPLQAAFVFLPKSFHGQFKLISNLEFRHHHHGIRHWTQYHIPPYAVHTRSRNDPFSDVAMVLSLRFQSHHSSPCLLLQKHINVSVGVVRNAPSLPHTQVAESFPVASSPSPYQFQATTQDLQKTISEQLSTAISPSLVSNPTSPL